MEKVSQKTLSGFVWILCESRNIKGSVRTLFRFRLILLRKSDWKWFRIKLLRVSCDPSLKLELKKVSYYSFMKSEMQNGFVWNLFRFRVIHLYSRNEKLLRSKIFGFSQNVSLYCHRQLLIQMKSQLNNTNNCEEWKLMTHLNDSPLMCSIIHQKQ